MAKCRWKAGGAKLYLASNSYVESRVVLNRKFCHVLYPCNLPRCPAMTGQPLPDAKGKASALLPEKLELLWREARCQADQCEGSGFARPDASSTACEAGQQCPPDALVGGWRRDGQYQVRGDCVAEFAHYQPS